MSSEKQMITVEVTYAEPDRQVLKQLVVPQGTTAIEAVSLSGIKDKFDSLNNDRELSLGIFSKKCDTSYELKMGDRVEIYRPLLIDPKEARRLKAKTDAKRKAESA